MAEHTHNLEVERSALGAILHGRAPGAWDTMIEIVQTPLAFYKNEHRIIVVGCLLLAGEGTEINAGTVAQRLSVTTFGSVVERLRDMEGLKGRLPPLDAGAPCSYEDSALHAIGGFNTVTDFPIFITNLARDCKVIAAHYQQRLAIEALAKAVHDLKAPTGMVQRGEIVDRALSACMAGTSVGGTKMADDGMRVALEAHDRRQSGDRPRCAMFGIPALDGLMQMRPGDLWILAAGPGCGKTSLLMHALTATADEQGPGSVALVSQEMDNQELGEIYIARGLKCTRRMVQDGALTLGQREQAAEVLARIAPLQIAVRDSGSSSVTDVAAWALTRKRMHPGLSLLAVDYLQILKRTNPRQTEYDCISEASRMLKQIARELHVPVLALSQMSREGRKQERGKGGALKAAGEPQLSDLRGSGSLEQDANGVVFLWKPDPSTQIVQAKVAKNRAGERGAVDLLWYPAEGQRFVDPADTVPHSSGRTRHDRITNPTDIEPPF